MSVTFEQRLANSYDRLSTQLRKAGDYVASNPVNAATRSLRAVARDSGLSPATFSRMATAVGYDGFESLREDMRLKIDRRVNNFADRAEQMLETHGRGAVPFFDAHVSACQKNLERLMSDIDRDRMEQIADRLHASRKVVLLGGLGSTGIVEYLSYMTHFFTNEWHLAGRMGSSLGASLSDLGKQDALIIVTKPPFSTRSTQAAKMARDHGVYTLVITDTHTFPALGTASDSLIVPSDSPHFYSSYAATLVLVEVLAGMLLSRAGPSAQRRIAEVEQSNRHLHEVWDG